MVFGEGVAAMTKERGANEGARPPNVVERCYRKRAGSLYYAQERVTGGDE